MLIVQLVPTTVVPWWFRGISPLHTGDWIATEDGGSDPPLDFAQPVIDNHSLENRKGNDDA